MIRYYVSQMLRFVGFKLLLMGSRCLTLRDEIDLNFNLYRVRPGMSQNEMRRAARAILVCLGGSRQYRNAYFHAKKNDLRRGSHNVTTLLPGYRPHPTIQRTLTTVVPHSTELA